ncbi:helix-turn-helix transcriptional regulator [Allobranchiibius sp. CTAmp26]|uniref:helix-turn-helix transcriptional regulator n=1 Tax=Allobranchiibius sp. CTAmp26 TaxID=2815214 RepID=UPI001AA1B260|nr:helix-turn-helix transcriptional regulator [Allobranchiibius sp. CTAmp26]MBO1754119.1 helix-turn-helix domain-containing protein [Allobranchiibius sp. CTAmp26]
MDDLTDSSRRRHELGSFLRARRERTSPSDVGLPHSPRRRTPGLRREELANLAGISTTWYTFLEQGRDVRPSTQVVTSIANALNLGEAERAHLLAIATDESRPAEDLEYLAPEVADIPMMVDPNPAYVTGSSYDLLAWNDAAARLFPGATDTATPNLARWMFTDPAAREALPDWTHVARGLLARLRANAGRHPGSPRFQRLHRELCAASPEAKAWWVRYDIATSGAGVKRVRSRDGQERLLTYASFQVSEQPEQILTIYRPA